MNAGVPATSRGRRDLVRDLERRAADGCAAFVVLADLDELREHNARHGLAAGDFALAAVASEVAGVRDAAGYDYAGDAFALVFEHDTPLDPTLLAPAVVAGLARLVAPAAAPVACSFGAASLPADHREVARVLALAERRLERQKASGLRPEDRLAEILVALCRAAEPERHRAEADIAELVDRVAGRLGLGSAERDTLRRAAALRHLAARCGIATLLDTAPCLADTATLLREADDLHAGAPLSAHVLVACRAYLEPGSGATAAVDARARTALAAHLEAVDLPGTLSGGAPGVPADADGGVSAIARLHALLDTAAVIEDQHDLPRALEAIAQAMSEALGFTHIIINLYRPEWDDFIVSTVVGDEETRHALLGSTYEWATWEPILSPRFEQRGAYLVYHGDFDWSEQAGKRYVPDLEAPVADEGAWHPEDEVFAPFHHTDGHLLGIFNIGAPLDGRRPSDGQLDTLVVVARHAARAVERVQLATAEAAHRRGLEHLLKISTELTTVDSVEAGLAAVARGTSEALGFASVSVHLADPRTGALRRIAQSRTDREAERDLPLTLEELSLLLQPRFEAGGCYLLELDEARTRVPVLATVAPSLLNGRGPRAWDRHWLLVPLVDRHGATTGAILADDPLDRLLPNRQRLQALRLFANQASSALESLAQQEELRFLADRDPLTRLLNRRALMEHLHAATRRDADRGALALAYCDLDGFKAVNDRHGHAAGDRLLQAFAGVLERSIREGDLAYRIGGDEFALLLGGCDREQALAIVDRILVALRDHGDELPDGVAASFGVVLVRPEERADPESLLARADEAMYEAKRGALAVRIAA